MDNRLPSAHFEAKDHYELENCTRDHDKVQVLNEASTGAAVEHEMSLEARLVITSIWNQFHSAGCSGAPFPWPSSAGAINSLLSSTIHDHKISINHWLD